MRARNADEESTRATFRLRLRPRSVAVCLLTSDTASSIAVLLDSAGRCGPVTLRCSARSPVQSTLLYDVLRRFASTMAHSFEINDVLQELADHAMAILEAEGAGVSVAVGNDRLRFVTSTSDRITMIEHAQDRVQAGPCTEAYETGDVVTATGAELDRWPEYAAAVRAAGLGAVVGLPLKANDHRIGALDVYAEAGRLWSDEDTEAAQVLADIATAYLLHAGELAKAHQLGTQLQGALDSRIVIEQAKGMLSRDHSITVDEAFALLRHHARSTNSNLRRIAEDIVERGAELPSTDD